MYGVKSTYLALRENGNAAGIIETPACLLVVFTCVHSFMADGVSSSLVTTAATAAGEPSRLPLSSASSSYPRGGSGPLSSSCIPPFGGAGCGATFPVVPRGLVFPWAPANKEVWTNMGLSLGGCNEARGQ